MMEKKEAKVPYSDDNFLRVSLEWLICTDQPIDALEHPRYRAMIEIAAGAPNGKVTIPSQKITRQEILNLLWDYMRGLKKKLMSPACSGKISLTCDGWDASNIDSYLAVTAHWIHEKLDGNKPPVWTLKMGLIGFVRLKGSHNGFNLGNALYSVAERLDIHKK
ncbi:hypothetical protein PQX77_017945, partial [Marasmius sp. AFHP31]